MILNLCLILGACLPNDFEWSYSSLERNENQNLRVLFRENDLDFDGLHLATWQPDQDTNGGNLFYRNQRLKFSDLFLIDGEFAIVCLRLKPQVRPGPDIARFLLFTKEGRFLDQITLDKNGKHSLFSFVAGSTHVEMTMINIATPPSSGYYTVGVTCDSPDRIRGFVPDCIGVFVRCVEVMG